MERLSARYAFVGTGIRWNRELGNALERETARLGIGVAYAGHSSPGDPGKNSLSFLKRLRELSPGMPVLSVGGTLGDARLLPSLPLTGPLYVQGAAGAYRFDDSHQAAWGSGPDTLRGTIIRREREGGMIVFPPH